MSQSPQVMEYKCPCCNAGLVFGSDTQQLTCEYCDNTFEISTVRAYNDSENEKQTESFHWENAQQKEWNTAEQETMRAFQCPACGGEIVTDEHTVATFCPFCDNPTIMPSRITGGLKPDAVIPFKTDKEDAKAAFLKLCKGKPLLPKMFTSKNRLEKITGIYVPFWLYDCEADYSGDYKATRIRTWSDSRYNYTKTDHYLLKRRASAKFSGIPMDASSKMENDFMESIEPYDYSQMVDFDSAYLSGYFADKYDVPSEEGQDRIRQRVDESIQDELQSTLMGYATAIPTARQLQVNHSKARYVLLPVWMLNTSFNGKIYTFAMNGQTGKMTGSLPVCRKRATGWFVKICAGVTVVATLLQFLLV